MDRPSPVARGIVFLIRGYQRGVSPMLPASCRYVPSCSSYAVEAVQVHGAARGGWLAMRRLLRCHPWGGSGYDPVPPRGTDSPTRGGDDMKRDAGAVRPVDARHEVNDLDDAGPPQQDADPSTYDAGPPPGAPPPDQ